LKFAKQTPITPLKGGIATPTLQKGLIGVAISAADDKRMKVKTLGFHPKPQKLLKKFHQNFNRTPKIVRTHDFRFQS